MRHLALALALVTACASGETTDTATDDGVDPVDVMVDDATFGCITDMTSVRRFYVDNLLGDLTETLEVAEATEAGTYPAGSLIQLVPFEAMVKREAGFSAESNDWEFFYLEVDEDGATIADRGVEDVENQFGGNCFSCHEPAAAFDYVCESGHGCVDLPLDEGAIVALQESDPRCGT